jgi:tetratricopeptide (TPR) repeat protein
MKTRAWHLSIRLVLYFTVLIVLSARVCSRAADLAADFDGANKLYGGGKFSEAAAAYEKLLQSGQASSALYFNLGNAWFKSGQFGQAIAAYHQAEQLTPRDPDIQANLRFARNQVQGPTYSSGRLQNWLARLTVNEWAVASAAALWLCFILLAVTQWRPAWKPTLRNYVIGLLVVAGLTFACTASALAESRSDYSAVVIVKDAAVHNSPLDVSPNIFTLHDGAEVRILDQKDDWLQVTTDPARIGWLHRNQVKVLP